MKQDKVKIDIKGTVEDTAKDVVEFVGFSAIILVLLGCLFAPCFTNLWEHSLKKKYNTNFKYDNYQFVIRDLAIINRRLWILAIVAWSFVIYCNVTRGV